MSESLSKRLRGETKEAHTRAERSGVMQRILRGNVDVHSYVALMRNLHAVYVALEREIARHSARPALAFVDLRALARAASIEADLDALASRSWRDLALTGVATEYASRLHTLGDLDPDRLIAHAYLRYLGDLSGGQMMRSVIARSLSLSEARGASGLAFYDFPRIEDQAAFKSAFRGSLDALQVDPDAIVEEAQLGYELHEHMFEEIGAGATP